MDGQKRSVPTSLASRVRAGVALLDEKQPGWHERVNLDTLDLDVGARCVVGQVFDHYGVGLAQLGLARSEDEFDFGFDAFREEGGTWTLQRLWSFVIRQRQAVAQ